MTPNRPRGRPRGTQNRLLHEHAGTRPTGTVELATKLAVVLPALRALPDFVPAQGARRDTLAPTAAATTTAPSLEDWRSAQCGAAGIEEDFYAQAEWIDLYVEAFGHAPPARAETLLSQTPLALSATAHTRLSESAHPEVSWSSFFGQSDR
ncbi:hypothetical protein [Sphaerotilus sp.]|uniref:hypothetical protein n=1 Tax=Sphaerotilus sp. TaxID=2093942 RepID=UPI002ACE515A|nr:hypothetical protein [Sphaerotilus sp.]MDZ7858442.1 hypothetical protein [Sphaerotilus sp.]